MTDIGFSRYSGLVLRHNIDLVKREIGITGTISDRTYIKLDKQLKLLEIQEEDINIVLNTSGGDLYSSFAIIDRIRNSPNNIHIIGTGMIMSAGISILAAGDTRSATKYTSFMHHGMSTRQDIWENIATQEHAIKNMKELDRMRFMYLAERTMKPYSFWASNGKMLDFNFNAEQALEYGLIEAIL